MQQDMALASDSLDSAAAGGSSLTADSLASDASGGSLASSGTGTDLASGGGVTGLASGGAVESMTLDPSGQATKGVPQTTDRALQLETIPNQAVDQLPQNTTTQGQIQVSSINHLLWVSLRLRKMNLPNFLENTEFFDFS